MKSNTVELIHNRRLLFDDRLSKEVVLNNTDPFEDNEGRSTYYMQICDRRYEPSL